MSENRVAKFIQKFVKINQINYELVLSLFYCVVIASGAKQFSDIISGLLRR